MLTNPNTLGLFEEDVLEISRLVHEAGALASCLAIIFATRGMAADAVIQESSTRFLAPVEGEDTVAYLERLRAIDTPPGYDVTVLRLDAADYGSAQRRSRVIVAGLRVDLGKLPPPPSPSRPGRSYWRTTRSALAGLGEPDGLNGHVFQPGARWSNKHWPAESYAELVRLLVPAAPGFRFAILGGNEDRPLGELISRSDPARCLDLTGRLSLTEMVEWIRLSELMVSNDTGPMHVAAALGTPVVALFGPTEPRRTGPYHQLDHVLQLDLPCVPCMKGRCAYVKPFACLRAISPAAVFEAVQCRLAAINSAGGRPGAQPLGCRST